MRFLVLLLMLSLSSVLHAGEPISIVTYNIRYPNPGDGKDFWPHRAADVASYLKQHDVFGLQEAKFSQLADMKETLSDFQRYSVGRDDGGQRGETTTIYFRSDRFTAEAMDTIWLSDKPTVKGSKGWDAALPRILSWVLLKDKTTNKQLLVANTHFDHRGKQARLESGKLIAEFLSAKTTELRGDKGSDIPAVLLGDFNCLIGSDPYQAIIVKNDQHQLRDAREVSEAKPMGPNSTWCGFKQIAPDRIIDHIFVLGAVDVLELEVQNPKTKAGRFASDHLPVRISVELRQHATMSGNHRRRSHRGN